MKLPRDGYEFLREAVPERLLRGMQTGDDVYEYVTAKISRRSVLKGLGIAGAAALAGPLLWAKPGYAAEPPRGIHIAYGTDPRREMSISWYTTAAVSKPVVDFGTTAKYGSTVAAHTVHYTVPFQSTTYQHHVTLHGLRAGTTYHYRVRHAGAASTDFTFTTSPDKVVPFRFTSFGDHGSDPTAAASTGSPASLISPATRQGYGTVFSSKAVAAVAAFNPAFHVHNGDMAYSCGGPQIAWDYWLDEIQPRAAVMPWMCALGNHEMELPFGPQGYDPYRSRLRNPTNAINWSDDRTSTFYAIRHSNVIVLMLDGNEAASEGGYSFNRGYLGGKQDRWIEASLKAARKDPSIDWVLVSFHNCMYCTDVVHGSDGGVRARWQKLFEKYNVDVVLNGHNHCYERTFPILGSGYTPLTPGEAADPQKMGVTYVCAGGGGQLAAPRAASTYPTALVFDLHGNARPEPAPWRAARVDGYSVAVFDVDPGKPGGKTTLTLNLHEIMTPARAVLDTLVLERPAKAAAVRALGPVIGASALPASVEGSRQIAEERLAATGDSKIGPLAAAAGAAALSAGIVARTVAGGDEPSPGA